MYVVDDDPAARSGLEFLIAALGWRTRAFASALDCLAAVDGAAPCCVVTDLHMPDIDGAELAATLARGAGRIGVVVVTAFDPDAMPVREARAAGAHILHKPVNADELERTLRGLEAGARKPASSADASDASDASGDVVSIGLRGFCARDDAPCVLLDRQLHVRFANEAHARFVGRAAGDLQGQPFLDAFPSGERARIAAAFADAIESQRAVRIAVRLRSTRSEPPRDWNMLAWPVVETGHERASFLLVHADSAPSGAGDAAAPASMPQSSEDLVQFAYAASHDLQAPLHSIIEFSQLLRRQLGAVATPEALKSLSFIEGCSERMRQLVIELLALAKAGADVPRDATVDTAELVQALATMLAPGGAGPICVDAALPGVRGNRAELLQLFQNLVGNGLKFHAPEVMPEVHVAAQREGPQWHFTISDNGIGIPEHRREKIFELFARLHPQDRYPGTGLGLALCKRIVERHGGRIWVDANEGPGSRFHFLLPAAPDS
ncbi:ATP-binding protein [Solimonas flava]|uniref:ATP-binding protein n=1 Tax=Solimonas flava TaxID=415849 RepID=UPI000411466A|nr:ATP-binding protein [Solimonas flava]